MIPVQFVVAVAIARECDQRLISGVERVGMLTDRQITHNTVNPNKNHGGTLIIRVNLKKGVSAAIVVAIESNVALIAPPKVLPRTGVNVGQVDKGVSLHHHGDSVTRAHS